MEFIAIPDHCKSLWNLLLLVLKQSTSTFSLSLLGRFICKHKKCKTVMNRGRAPPRDSDPVQRRAHGSWPKGWRARGKSEDTGQRLSRGICCNGKCTGSAKGWMCAYLDLFNKPRPHWPVMTTFKIWPQDWPYIIPTKFRKNQCSRSRDINFPYF